MLPLSAISARDLYKQYGPLTAVDGIDLEVRAGETFGFLGPNGAGKTTTIRMLTGLVRPTRGQAWVNGHSVLTEGMAMKRSIGIVPEESILHQDVSVQDNLAFMATMYEVPRRQVSAGIRELLERFGLADRARTRFGALSKGLKRRAVVAAALVHRQSVLFLDEPTSGLDVESARALRRTIAELGQAGVTVFLTTHRIEDADLLCARVALISRGRLVATGTPEELKQRVAAGGEKLLRVTTDRALPPAARSRLLSVTRVRELGNGTLELATTGLRATLDSLLTVTAESGVGVLSVNTVLPTLEDAFVELTGTAIGTGGGPGAGKGGRQHG